MARMSPIRAAALCAAVMFLSVPVPASAQVRPDSLHRPFDEILEVNVRDGFVYYNALRQTRGALDRYVRSLDVPVATFEAWLREDRLAFWINAYNAFVLQTVVDRFPIRGRAKEYPPDSVRQIPGAFDRRTFRAAGRAVTLDEIEKKILPEFEDPRVYFAVSAAAVASGRLRSEAYRGADLERQLAAATAEFLTTQEHVALDRGQNELAISAIIGWHEQDFVAAYGGGDPRFETRSPRTRRSAPVSVGAPVPRAERVPGEVQGVQLGAERSRKEIGDGNCIFEDLVFQDWAARQP
jgi:hypothetical protein